MIPQNPNRLWTLVHAINNSKMLPDTARRAALTLAFNSNIRYAGTTGISIREWNENRAVVELKNRWHIQNHLKGIHATAMATLAESTTGMLFGLYVPDRTHVPLLKSMTVQFVKRATGDLRAVATLTHEQKQRIQTTDKGALVVPVTVTDSEGKEPITCQMEWAWTTKRNKQSGGGTGGPEPQQTSTGTTRSKL
mmetsp:Transcript_11914/g.26654  ORF Transcript_11914/g.26654 Transcript_11914/m.26654 type:complete len:194 (+) Transcript_11914:115-696(+)